MTRHRDLLRSAPGWLLVVAVALGAITAIAALLRIGAAGLTETNRTTAPGPLAA